MNKNRLPILVVDDEQGLRDLLSYELTAKGYRVVTAADGFEAVEKVRQEKFDLVISDIMMPRMDGIQTLEEIKKIDPELEVIMATGFGSVETAVQSMKKGAYDFIQKPYSMDEMEAVISRALEKKGLKARVGELAAARDAAVEASRAKSEFLATMSHEIRTPMNAIVGMAELLAETPLNEEQQEYVQILKRGGDNLLNLINDILDLSKVESGHLELEEIEFNLQDFVERTIEFMAVRAHQKNLELAYHLPQDAPGAVIGDANRLRQILVNLLGNAIKFTETGEVVVDVHLSPEDEEKKCELLFSVRDTGIGVPGDKIQAIFDPFTQADSSTTRKYGGTGLGLGISKKLVELMGGKMWVESEVGKGSTFSFVVRLGINKNPKITAAAGEAADLKGMKVLIVDDNATNRFILREALAGWGAVTREVESGSAGLAELKRARSAGSPYKLLLLDCRMPEMDGFEVARKTKEEGITETIVMMLTSDARSGDIARSKELGMAAYLMKPVKRADLFKVISRVLRTRTVASAPLPPAPPKTSLETPTPRRILLVEDSEDNRILIQSYLKKTLHQVDIAVNGREAVDKFKTNFYDLIFMDMHMPLVDGYEATKIIRSLEANGNGRAKHVPIIALTADALKEDAKKCFEAGCDAHLTKPIKKEPFLEALGRYVGSKQGQLK